MKVIDLSHTMHPEMPVFPGTEPPVFQQANTLEKDGFAEVKMTLYSHTGTHMDAPAHMEKNGLTLDQYNIDYFIGKALIIDFANTNIAEVDVKDLEVYENKILRSNFLILKTGWSKYWGSENYFHGFPVLTEKATKWLTTLDLRGIGIDAISVDHIESTTFPVHHILFEKNMVIIENITNLDAVYKEEFVFSCMPLKTKDADGSPVRAIAIEYESI
ncbi:kynurenine formamidase KynB [Clostridium aceticum]|uniref:Kynurenine formamidase n=1 Tax=Clostridium aceticum TaxID=84022 RepID=A0A0D8IDV3_9CLOT|nr:cyclase family protein [Clostridium aceticum]AKL94204.1 kynurenine formamidase KynB [Clostridium aceticum]KJF28458.1 hydrolase [Clostridium aceticum]